MNQRLGLFWLKGLVAVALLYGLAIHTWFTAPMLDLAAQGHALQQEQQSLRAEIAQMPEWQQRNAELQQRQPNLQHWLSADANSASVLLGQQLELWLSAAPVTCQLVSKTPQADTRSGRFVKTGWQARLRCSTLGLAALLQKIESESSAVRVENMQIASRSAMAAVAGQNQGLDVTLDIVAYGRVGVSKP
jgi:general secretion pathway protein M